MLEVGSHSLSLKSSPDCKLVHPVGLSGPDGEFVGIQGELLLEALDGCAVIEEQNL
jgi:hypothetical protein